MKACVLYCIIKILYFLDFNVSDGNFMLQPSIIPKSSEIASTVEFLRRMSTNDCAVKGGKEARWNAKISPTNTRVRRVEYFTADFPFASQISQRNAAACVTAPLSRSDCCTIITTRLDKHLLYLIAASLSLTLLAHGCKCCQTIPRRRRKWQQSCDAIGATVRRWENGDAIFERSSFYTWRNRDSLNRQISSCVARQRACVSSPRSWNVPNTDRRNQQLPAARPGGKNTGAASCRKQHSFLGVLYAETHRHRRRWDHR